MAFSMTSLVSLIALAILACESAVITTCKSSALELRLGLANEVDVRAVESSSSLVEVDLPSLTDPLPRIASRAPLSSCNWRKVFPLGPKSWPTKLISG